MAIIVEWDQWYRTGQFGDDLDFRTEKMQFETRDQAIDFYIDLIAGKHRGWADLMVNEDDVVFRKGE